MTTETRSKKVFPLSMHGLQIIPFTIWPRSIATIVLTIVLSQLWVLAGSPFLNSYFAHCALVYVICKNVVKIAWDSKFPIQWPKSRKQMVILVTVGVVHECFVLSVIPRSVVCYSDQCDPKG